MSEEEDESLTLVVDRPPREAADRAKENVALGQAYATAKGHATLALQFLWQNGRSVSIPYGYLPICWMHSPSTLLIEYPRLFTIGLTGKRLDELEARISAGHVTWIRELGEELAASLPLAVTRIEILRLFPSREAGGGD